MANAAPSGPVLAETIAKQPVKCHTITDPRCNVFKVSRPKVWPPLMDLSSVRRTLTPIKDNLAQVPALAKAANAMATVIAELEAAERATNAARLYDNTKLQLSSLTRRH